MEVVVKVLKKGKVVKRCGPQGLLLELKVSSKLSNGSVQANTNLLGWNVHHCITAINADVTQSESGARTWPALTSFQHFG